LKPSQGGCLIVQSDLSPLLEENPPQYEQARNHMSCFAEMVKSPGYIHAYKLTLLSFWNAA
jgi:DNA excision repair protein ERCC-3